jgi:isopropylmalate/homocitrate/citramalate synthase
MYIQRRLTSKTNLGFRQQLRLNTTSTFNNELKLHEVTPRDGLQNEKKRLTVLEKLSLIREIVKFNPNGIEVCSFVRGDLVPNMAGASELCSKLAEDEVFMEEFKGKKGGYVAALVPNMKGFEEVSEFASTTN